MSAQIRKAPYHVQVIYVAKPMDSCDDDFLCSVQSMSMAEEESQRKKDDVHEDNKRSAFGLGRTREKHVFIVLHRNFIAQGCYDERCTRSRGARSGLCFGTMDLGLKTNREGAEEIFIGMIDVVPNAFADQQMVQDDAMTLAQ